jgi:hypothetical protein
MTTAMTEITQTGSMLPLLVGAGDAGSVDIDVIHGAAPCVNAFPWGPPPPLAPPP